MLAFTLSSLKDATSHLFTQPSFDDFDVLSVTIASYFYGRSFKCRFF